MGFVVAAFGEEHAARLTGVSVGQLRYWDQTDFFSPSFPGDSTVGRVYSFRDIVSLKVLNALHNEHQVSVQHLRKVREKLASLSNEAWAETRLWVTNRKVVWHEPATAKAQEVVSGQFVIPQVEVSAVVADTTRALARLNKRDKSQVGHVTKTRLLNHNDPVLAGTRVRVSAIKQFADAGFSAKQIVREFPDLTERDVRAALSYVEPVAA